MEKIVITEKQILNAYDYIPLATKIALAQSIARACIEMVHVGATKEEAVKWPKRANENLMTKHRAVMGCFLKYYLRIDWEGWEEDICMPLNLYDMYCGSHIMNQIERMKGISSLRDKIFDILHDFKLFKGILDAEIYSLMGHLNDTANRMAKIMDVQTDPETATKMIEEIQKLNALAQKEKADD